MIDTRDPKFIVGKEWKSTEYQEWIKKNCLCVICSLRLATDDMKETHHHRHMRNKDYMYVPLCLSCHNQVHESAATKEKLFIRYGFSEDLFDAYVVNTLSKYLIEKGYFNAVINSLSEIFMEIA